MNILFGNVCLYINYLIKKYILKKNIMIEYLDIYNYLKDEDGIMCYCSSCNFFRFLFTPFSYVFITKPINKSKKYKE